MNLWRNIEKNIILIPSPDFPHFYYILGANLGSLLYGNVSVMRPMYQSRNKINNQVRQRFLFIDILSIYSTSI